MSDLDFSRQSDLYPSDVMSNLSVCVIGCGGIGSNVVNLLARIGIRKFTLYDNDVVESPNVPPTWFRLKDVGLSKVEALKLQLLENFGITTVSARDMFYNVQGGTFDVVICCTDNIVSRVRAFDDNRLHWKLWIDARMGGDQCSVYCITRPGPQEAEEKYEKTLQRPDTDLPCGMKSTAALTTGIIPGFIGTCLYRYYGLGQQPPYEMFFKMGDLWMTIDSQSNAITQTTEVE